MTIKHFTILSVFCTSLAMFTGCKKLVDISAPTGQLTRGAVFLDSATAVSAVSGMYSYMYNESYVGDAAFKNLITLTSSMAADELYYFSSSAYDQYRNNAISINNNANLTIWGTIYAVVYQANSIIEGLEEGPLSQSLRNQLTGEALFIRAVCHFYLANLYGDVPLVLSTDVAKNSVMGRTPVQDVYARIKKDLVDAAQLMVNDYTYSPGGTRTRANRWAATAMLARVALYTGDYAGAVTHATTVIDQSSLYSMPALANAFFASSPEAILQFHTNLYNYTYIQNSLSPSTDAASGGPSYVMRDDLLKAFEPGDARRRVWTDSVAYNGRTYVYPGKYKRTIFATSSPLEYDMFLRLGEQYLIRAEANAQLEKIEAAHQDLEQLRSRAGLGRPAANDKPSMLLAIEHERQVELFAEYAHRWFDLKRTGRINAVMIQAKPNTWQSYAALYPIPQAARSTNKQLSQNDKY